MPLFTDNSSLRSLLSQLTADVSMLKGSVEPGSGNDDGDDDDDSIDMDMILSMPPQQYTTASNYPTHEGDERAV